MPSAGNGSAEVAHRAQQLLEHSLLSELRAVVARALSGLDMFAGGQLSELDLLGSDLLENAERDVRTPRCCSALAWLAMFAPWPGLSGQGQLFAAQACSESHRHQ